MGTKWVSNEFTVPIVWQRHIFKSSLFFELIFYSRRKFSILILSLARPWGFFRRQHQFFWVTPTSCILPSETDVSSIEWNHEKSKSAISRMSTFGFTYDSLTWRKWTQKPLVFFQCYPVFVFEDAMKQTVIVKLPFVQRKVQVILYWLRAYSPCFVLMVSWVINIMHKMIM